MTMSEVVPRVFIKPGCPWCVEAEAFLKAKGIAYEAIDVYSVSGAMDEMRNLSGQTSAPTMNWDGDILADFGVDELEPFLKGKGVI